MMNDEPPIVHVEPNPFWRENAKTFLGESVSTIESAAKELILVNSLLVGVYFHAITFSDVKPVLTHVTAAIYLAPIALWIMSLFFSVLTVCPCKYKPDLNINSSSDCKKFFKEVISKKDGMLLMSEFFLIASFIFLFAAVMHYLVAI